MKWNVDALVSDTKHTGILRLRDGSLEVLQHSIGEYFLSAEDRRMARHPLACWNEMRATNPEMLEAVAPTRKPKEPPA